MSELSPQYSPSDREFLADPIGAIEHDLHERHGQRRRAVEAAWRLVETAQTPEEAASAADNLELMQGVYDEFVGQFPETFPPKDE